MQRTFLLIVAFATSFMAQAQTKKIAFKSHSGSMTNFSAALENDLFETDNSNFGMAPVRDIITAQLDSVIFICDTMAILVTSEYCTKTDRRTQKKPIVDSKLWKAGREVAIDHPLFSRQHSLDSIKSVIAEKYNFKNPIDKVIFVGYDNKKPKEKKTKKKKTNELIVSAASDSPVKENGQLAFLFGTVVLTSMIAAKLSQRNS